MLSTHNSNNGRASRRGQALILVTLCLVAMFGLVGLAVDFGWAFYVRKQAQTAADAAALAAVKESFYHSGPTGPFACSGTMACVGASTPCEGGALAGTNLAAGCAYAEQLGFPSTRFESGTNTSVDVETGSVPVYYYATAVVTRHVPQLFSAVLGNSQALVSARATAAVMNSIIQSSLIVTNQASDRARFGMTESGSRTYLGENIHVQGSASGAAVEVSGGVDMNSGCKGVGTTSPPSCVLESSSGAYSGNLYAGAIDSNATVHAMGDITIAGEGTVDSKGNWNPTPKNGDVTQDIFRGIPQPPAASNYGPLVAVPGGILDNTVCSAGFCPAGRYYASNPDGTASGLPIQVNGDINFGSGNEWGEYIIWGGIQSKGSAASVTFHPGRYIFAGALPNQKLIQTSTNLTLLDNSPRGLNSDAGEMFIFTNWNYSGNLATGVLPPGMSQVQLDYAGVTIQSGSSGSGGNGGGNGSGKGTNAVQLHGLNKTLAPDELKDYNATLFWFDRKNSLVDLNPNTGDPTCTTTANCPSSRVNVDVKQDTPKLDITAAPSVYLLGLIYQPRGAWTYFHGGGGYSGPLQLLTGAIEISGGAQIDLGVPTRPVTRKVVALIR